MQKIKEEVAEVEQDVKEWKKIKKEIYEKNEVKT